MTWALVAPGDMGIQSSAVLSLRTETETQHGGSQLQLTWRKVRSDGEYTYRKGYFISCKIFASTITLLSTLEQKTPKKHVWQCPINVIGGMQAQNECRTYYE